MGNLNPDTGMSLQRRSLLKAVGAIAAGPALAGSSRAEAASTQQRVKTGRIDVQFHFSPTFYTEMVKKTKHPWTDRWSVEAALAYMENNSVAAGVMSVSTPSVNFLPAAESIVVARQLNDAAAQVARDNPGRFGNFATLPMNDVGATLTEISYCLDTLKMDGVCMMSNVSGLYLGHPSFAPIFDELNRRKAVLFIHPTDPADMGQLKMAPVVEWPFDTCRAAVDLIYTGTIRRCPDIRIILAHAGGALPSVARRVEEMSVLFPSAKPPVMLDEAIKQIASFYYDLAISAHENTIGALRHISSLQNVLFACDWPFAPPPAIASNVNGFEALKLTAAERVGIERGNAARLFPQLVKS
jgi:predicted TIM-barrel fold metal-dependent hydrolase